MITYLLKSGLCLALLLAFYHLVLEREKMHKFNRFYLLGSILFSFLAPFYVIYKYVPVVEYATPIFVDTTDFTITEPIIEETIDYTPYVIGIHALITLVFTIRFVKNLFNILQKIRKNTHIKHDAATLVLVDDAIGPHTFWNYIFINKKDYENKEIETELFTHELTHVTQKHTIDVLLIELLKVVFWFNPILYLIKKSIQLNHEFLADENVVSSHQNVTTYQYLLLNKTAWNNDYQLASSLQYSLTKKRLIMMTKQTSKASRWLKKLAVLPLLVGAIFLFAERVEAQEEANPKIVAEYNNLAKKYNIQPTNKMMVKLKDVERIKFLYAKLTKKQKFKAEPFPNFPPPPPSPVIKNGKNVSGGDFVPPPPPPKPSFEEQFNSINEQIPPSNKKATEKEVEEYNSLALKLKKENIVKQKDLKKIESLYRKLDKKQRFKSESYPKIYFPPVSKRGSRQSIETNTEQLLNFKNEKDFLASVKRIGNKVQLKCYNCYRWAKLEVPLNKEYIVTDFGFSNGKNLNNDKYAFKIKATDNKIILNGLKNTAWIDLQFSLYKGKEQFFNKTGMISEVQEKAQNIDKSSPEYHYTKQTFRSKNTAGKKITKKYYELSETGKKNWLLFPPNIYTKKQISLTEFNSLKDANAYVVRIDGVVIKNKLLNNYKPSDFVSFSSSRISKWAKLPQEYHYNLLTEKGLELNQELNKIKNARLKRFQRKSNFIKNDTITPTSKKQATPKEVAAYNELAKKHNSRPLKSRKIKVKDYYKLKELYGMLSDKQKQQAEPFPTFPPPPKIDKVYTYQRMAHRVRRTSKNRKANLWFLKDLYAKMNKKERAQVTHPSKVLDNKTSQIETIYEQPSKKSAINNLKNVTSKASNSNKEEFGGVIFEEGYTPKPKTGWTKINGETFYFVKEKNKTEYFNRWGQEVDKNGKILKTQSKTSSKSSITKDTKIGNLVSQELKFLKKINPNFNFSNYDNKIYFLNNKKTSLVDLNNIDLKRIKSASILKKDNNTLHIYVQI